MFSAVILKNYKKTGRNVLETHVSSTREIQSNRWSVEDKIKAKIKKKDNEHQTRKISTENMDCSSKDICKHNV